MGVRLSVVIPAYNEESELPATLEAANKAIAESGLACELIVSDDDSTDRTPQIAAEFGAIVHHAHCRQIAGNRNAGASVARGEILLFVDADTRITVDSLRGVDQAVRAGADGGGSLIEFDKPCPLWARAAIKPMMWIYPRLGLASGAFLYCTREMFDSIGGFDESYYAAEEAIMSRAIARRGNFVFLRCPVVTSSRKLRSYSMLEIWSLILKMAFGGHRWARSQKGKQIWYEENRRDDGR